MTVSIRNGRMDDATRPAAWLGNSEMAGRICGFGWSMTRLGPLADWPSSLRSAVATSLHSRFQMAIYWGPDLNRIYNDAERDIRGKLHPGALGMPARKLLRDSWAVVGPQLHAVIQHGDATWDEDQPLTFDRRGMPETGYFTYSYSPIRDDESGIGGVLLVTQETTPRVLAERRIGSSTPVRWTPRARNKRVSSRRGRCRGSMNSNARSSTRSTHSVSRLSASRRAAAQQAPIPRPRRWTCAAGMRSPRCSGIWRPIRSRASYSRVI